MLHVHLLLPGGLSLAIPWYAMGLWFAVKGL